MSGDDCLGNDQHVDRSYGIIIYVPVRALFDSHELVGASDPSDILESLFTT